MSKAVEAVARGIDPEAWDERKWSRNSLGLHKRRQVSCIQAEAAIAAYKAHLEAEGMVVVPAGNLAEQLLNEVADMQIDSIKQE